MRLQSDFLNGLFVSILYGFAVRYFLPAMGMNPSLQYPLFIGGIVSLAMRSAYLHNMNVTKDIDASGFMYYQLASAGSVGEVVLSRLCGQMLSLSITLGSYMLLGYVMMRDSCVCLFSGSLALVFVAITSFLATFCMFWSYRLRLDRYLDLFWPRVLGPMIVFGGVHFTWHKMHLLSPRVAKIFLCSPLLYCTEGLRASLLGNAQSIPLLITVPMLFMLSGMFFLAAMYQLQKRTDCVMR